jgi:hypothetical protein
MMKNKAIFFSLDALIALIVVFLIVLIAFPILNSNKKETQLHYDILSTLSNIKIGEVDLPVVQSLIASGEITDLDKSILEQIGEFYITDTDTAKVLASSILQDLETNENIGIWYGNTLIAMLNSTSYESSQNRDVARQIISGIQEGESISGFSARAFLSNNLRNEYFYFGGYVGDGNVTARIDYSGNITMAEMELVVRSESGLFETKVNGISEGYNTVSSDEFTPVVFTLPTDNLVSGANNIELRGDNLHVAGGFIRVTYKSESQYKQPERYYFPGMEGLINLYDGFYIPGTLNSLLVSLHINNIETATFLNIGNVTVYNGSTNGEETIIIDNAQLQTLLDYDSIVNKTIPLRLGLENVTFVSNFTSDADVFSVTDLSGSMQCSIPSCYWSQSACNSCGGNWLEPIIKAKDANNAFIDAVLNVSGNNVGLVGYENVDYEEDYHELSNVTSSLQNQVTAWSTGGGTCTCCGINRAINGYLGRQSLYYNFENNVIDQTDNNNDGTPSENFEYIIGIDGNAINFSSNGHVEIPDIITSEEGTISMWIKPQSLSKSHTLFDASNGVEYFFIDLINPGTLRFWLEDSQDRDFQDASFDYSSIPNPTSWHHIAAVWKYGGENFYTKLYVDGVSVDSDTDTGYRSIPNFFTPYLGETRSSYFTTWQYDGSIDEMRIYSEALSDSEIQGLADQNAICGNYITEVGEVCDYSDTKPCVFNKKIGKQKCNSQCTGYGSCITTGKIRSVVVMSDGIANGKCPVQGSGDSKEDARLAACSAFDEYGITVNAIAFGSGADQATLTSIAACGNGTFYSVPNITDIVNIYQGIAEDIIQATYSEQTISIEGELYTKLFSDSYIEFNYTKEQTPFGLIVTAEKQFENTTYGTYEVPVGSSILETNVISYSGPRWTDTVKINNLPIYDLSDYGNKYITLGDPYSVNIPNSLVTQNNNVNLFTGLSPIEIFPGSASNKIIYTILKNASSFSPVKPLANGCSWTILFEGGSEIITNVPNTYVGGDDCYYNLINPSGPTPSGGLVANENDAIQVSVLDLLRDLDFDDDNKIDIQFTQQDLQISLTQLVGIPFTWSTEVQVRVWN